MRASAAYCPGLNQVEPVGHTVRLRSSAPRTRVREVYGKMRKRFRRPPQVNASPLMYQSHQGLFRHTVYTRLSSLRVRVPNEGRRHGISSHFCHLCLVSQ